MRDGQCSNRQVQNAIIVAARIVDRGHKALINSTIIGMLLMEIEGTFPTATNESLVKVLNAKHMDGDLMKCAEIRLF